MMRFKIGKNVILKVDTYKGKVSTGYIDGEFFGRVEAITTGFDGAKVLTVSLGWNNSTELFKEDGSSFYDFPGMSIHPVRSDNGKR